MTCRGLNCLHLCRLQRLFLGLTQPLTETSTRNISWGLKAAFVDPGGRVVKVLCYKSGGRQFDPSCYHWNFSLI